MKRKPKIDADVRALIDVRNLLTEIEADFWNTAPPTLAISSDNLTRAHRLANIAQGLLAERITERLRKVP